MVLIPVNYIEATSFEQALIELAITLQKLEALENFNPTKKNLINVQINTDTGIAQITANVPVDFKTLDNGYTVMVARAWLAELPVPSDIKTIV